MFPPLAKLLRTLVACGDVHGADRRRDRARERDRLHRGAVEPADGNDDDWRARRGERLVEPLEDERVLHGHVVAVDREEQDDEDRQQDERDPGTLGELGDDDDDEDDGRHRRADGVDRRPPLPPRGTEPPPSPDEAGLPKGEREEHADRVERYEVGHAPFERDEHDRRDKSQGDDPEREREPLTAIRELPRHETIVREHRCEPRKAGEPGVRGEREDDRGRELDQVVHRPDTHQRSGDEAVEGLLLGAVRRHADRLREEREAEKDRPEQRAHDHQRDRRVAALVALHARDAVRDGLASGKTDGSRRERAEHEKDGERLEAFRGERLRRLRGRRDISRRDAVDAVDDERRDRSDVDVGRAGEHDPRLADPAKVAEHEYRDEREPDQDPLVVEDRREARDCGDAGRGRGRHGEDVVDEQRRGRNESRQRPQVVARDDVAPAAVRVRGDDLRLREDDDREHPDDRERHRREENECTYPREREHAHRFLGGVRARRDVVRPEDRETGDDREPLGGFSLNAERRAEQDPADGLERAPERALWAERRLARHVMPTTAAEFGLVMDPYVAVTGKPAGLGGAVLEGWCLGRLVLSLVVRHVRASIVSRGAQRNLNARAFGPALIDKHGLADVRRARGRDRDELGG